MPDQFSIGILTAILAGTLSFLSPCVLPLIPGYLSFITGLSLEELTKSERRAWVAGKAVTNTIAFVIGFSVVFIALGASATTVGLFLKSHLGILGKIAGVGIIILGLHTAQIIRIPFLYYEKRIQKRTGAHGIFRAFLAGIFFALGWTPCVGPILAGILAIAATEHTLSKGVLLLSAYSFGLGLLFIISAMFLSGFLMAFSRIKRHLQKIEVASGVLLIMVGALILTNKLSIISSKLAFLNPEALMASKTETSTPKDARSSVHVAERIKQGIQAGARMVDYGRYDFGLTTIAGEPIRLSDFGGRIVLVNFWAPWCPPCRLETPGFVNLYQKYSQAGFVIIGIGVNTNERQVRNFIKEYGITYAVTIEKDSEISDRYGVFGIPASFLFAPDGSLYQTFQGYTDEKQLESKLEKLLKRIPKN